MTYASEFTGVEMACQENPLCMLRMPKNRFEPEITPTGMPIAALITRATTVAYNEKRMISFETLFALSLDILGPCLS
jgi:hypothetical protein